MVLRDPHGDGIPPEVYLLMHHATNPRIAPLAGAGGHSPPLIMDRIEMLKIVVLLFNVAIVWYLVAHLIRTSRAATPAPLVDRRAMSRSNKTIPPPPPLPAHRPAAKPARPPRKAAAEATPPKPGATLESVMARLLALPQIEGETPALWRKTDFGGELTGAENTRSSTRR